MDDIDFTNAPYAIFAEMVLITEGRLNPDGSIDIEPEDDFDEDWEIVVDNRASVTVALSDDGSVRVISDEEIADRGITLHSEHALGTIVGLREGTPFRFQADWMASTVAIEGRDDPMSVDEFRARALRCGADVQNVAACSFMMMAHRQRDAVAEAGLLDMHESDIRNLAQARMALHGAEYEGRMYDLISSDLDDGRDAVEVLRMIHAERPPLDSRDPILGETGVERMEPVEDDEDMYGEHAGEMRRVPLSFVPIPRIPEFNRPQVRAIYEKFMTPLLGGAGIDDTVRSTIADKTSGGMAPSGDAKDAILEQARIDEAGVRDTLRSMARRSTVLAPFDGGNAIPGYRTEEPEFFEFSNLSVLVFSDFMGSYAYAWRPEIKPEFEPRAGIGNIQRFFLNHMPDGMRDALGVTADPADYAFAAIPEGDNLTTVIFADRAWLGTVDAIMGENDFHDQNPLKDAGRHLRTAVPEDFQSTGEDSFVVERPVASVVRDLAATGFTQSRKLLEILRGFDGPDMTPGL